MAQINTRIVLRNDTSANWEAVKDTATLMVGEMGIETDTGLFKIGNIGFGTAFVKGKNLVP